MKVKLKVMDDMQRRLPYETYVLEKYEGRLCLNSDTKTIMFSKADILHMLDVFLENER